MVEKSIAVHLDPDAVTGVTLWAITQNDAGS